MSNFRKYAASRVAALAMLPFASFSALAADLAPNAAPIMLAVPDSYTYGASFGMGAGSFTDAHAFMISPADFNSIATTISASPVPEPSRSLTLLAGLVLLGFQLTRTMRDRD